MLFDTVAELEADNFNVLAYLQFALKIKTRRSLFMAIGDLTPYAVEPSHLLEAFNLGAFVSGFHLQEVGTGLRSTPQITVGLIVIRSTSTETHSNDIKSI